MWTHFYDMNSGGGTKEDWSHIYVELPEEQAKIFFYNRFGHNPERVSCTCCGSDYSISSDEDLAQLTGYHRHCAHDNERYTEEPDNRYGKQEVIPLDKYVTLPSVLVIRREDIKDEELEGDVPSQGYVWVD